MSVPGLSRGRGCVESPADGVDLVVVPGGDIGSVLEDGALASLRSRARVVAAICHGTIWAGARGDRARARRHAHGGAALGAAPGLRRAPPDRYLDEDVVVDGPLVTAKPWAAIDFAKKAALVSGAPTREEGATISER